MTDCTGLGYSRFQELLVLSVRAADRAILADVLRQTGELYERQERALEPPATDAGDVPQYGHRTRAPRTADHGLILWFDLLHHGDAKLPTVMPTAVLLAYRNGFLTHPRKRSPWPYYRCADCRMALPNSRPDGCGSAWEACPVCGSDRLERMDLSMLWAKRWVGDEQEPAEGAGG